ncbi:hypothetical protein LguiB_029776 [Lonicera macranthoides]
METRASKRRKLILLEENERKERERDRISDLPDALLHHILSFFPVHLIAQTSILSKRFRYLWYSCPSLDFSTIQCKIPINRTQSLSPKRLHCLKAKFMDFLPTILSKRNQQSNIKSFRLKGNTCITLPCLYDSIRGLVKNSIEELDLDVFIINHFDLPRCLFACESLRVLTLKPNNPNLNPQSPNFVNFRFPTSYVIASSGLQSLHTLSLTRVHFIKCNSIDDLFSDSSFPHLKKLYLKNCKGIPLLNISCPVLENLELDSMQLNGLGVYGTKLEMLGVIRCFKNYSNQNWVKIIAPQLRNFHWEYNAITEKCLINSFTALHKGIIYFLNERLSATKLRSAAYLVCVFSFAKHMFVGSLVVELLSEIDETGSLPISFSNLITLELHTGLNKSDIPGIVCLLRSCPVLNKLTIVIKNYYRTGSSRWNKDLLDNSNFTEEQYWESQSMSLKSLHQHLKVVNIKVCGDEIYESAFELVKFFLSHGIMLNEMILSSENSLLDPLLWRKQFGSQIMEFPKASADVKVVYV